MTANVLLIAVGGIGFRHFQALLNCESDFELHVININTDTIERAKAYAAEQVNHKTIHYYASVGELEKASCFQIAIIATSSLPRRAVFEELIAHCVVRTVIFEKVLFPSPDDYEEVGRLLRERKMDAYVNCARRVQTVYRKLREELRSAKRLCACIRGTDWGLACNSIHMLDLFAYLSSSDTERISCNGCLLEEQIFESKRKGYIEFYGKLTGKIGETTSYLMECGHGPSRDVFEFFTEKTYYYVNESEGLLITQDLEGGEPIKQYFELAFVSQTTTWVVDRLLRGEAIELTGFAESARLHLPILREFLKRQNKIQGSESSICPIT